MSGKTIANETTVILNLPLAAKSFISEKFIIQGVSECKIA